MGGRLLDLFCGAGGAAMGYYRAGFADIVGVDIKPMSRYPFEFVQDDALEYLAEYGHEFDAIHASPPCQAYSTMNNIHKNWDNHPDLVDPTRELLEQFGKPWVIENVKGAPLDGHLMLCGTMFGLRIIRHRYFESNCLSLCLMSPCNHSNVYDPWHGGPGVRSADEFREVMGIDWMSQSELSNAIPPAYTEFIGKQLMKVLNGR